MQDLSVLPGDMGSFSHVLPYRLPGIALRTEAVAEFGGTPGKQDLSSAAKQIRCQATKTTFERTSAPAGHGVPPKRPPVT